MVKRRTEGFQEGTFFNPPEYNHDDSAGMVVLKWFYNFLAMLRASRTQM